jgi:hypothetical protein
MVRRPFDIWALAYSQSSQKRPGKTNIHTPVENISFVSREDSAGPLPDIHHDNKIGDLSRQLVTAGSRLRK